MPTVISGKSGASSLAIDRMPSIAFLDPAKSPSVSCGLSRMNSRLPSSDTRYPSSLRALLSSARKFPHGERYSALPSTCRLICPSREISKPRSAVSSSSSSSVPSKSVSRESTTPVLISWLRLLRSVLSPGEAFNPSRKSWRDLSLSANCSKASRSRNNRDLSLK